MNKLNFSLLCVAATVLSSCSSKLDIVIADFEGKTFNEGWKVEGDAFGSGPSMGALEGQQNVKGFEGHGLLNSFHGGDDSRGTVISSEFKIERDYINFLIGGGFRPDTYIELLVDGKSVYKSRSVVESETLNWLSWDVKQYTGKNAVIQIVDNQRGPWGHILIDQIEMSNTEKSNIVVDYTVSFDATDKYLLVPIEDEGPHSKVQLQVDGQNIGVPMNIRVAQTKIDHWVPINIEQYKGKTVNLVFDHVKRSDIGFAQIKQSNNFDYDYNEKYRPLYHFSPQYGWVNDPNGMVYKDGEYHLFYQWNPYGSNWSNMTWGHAITKDLKKWEYSSGIITPDSIGSIFSGSAVIDKNNTAGFGKDALVAIYTSDGSAQTQSISYSLDNGRTFTRYAHNPVLTDPNISDFRDPKVFWHDATQKWVMSLATQQTITFYESKNLKEWNKLSEFGKGIGDHGGVWECPDLFPLTYNGQTKWVLFVSINPGGPNGGSATQYFIGNFDGKTFKPDSMAYPIWLDYGRDNYAGVTWSNVPTSDGRRLFIGWMSNWDYAQKVPTVNFRNAMTVPRELKLASNGKHLVVANYPVSEFTDLRRDNEKISNITVQNSYTIDKLLNDNQGAYELEFTINVPAATNSFAFSLTNKKDENLKFNFDLANEKLSVNRAKSGLIDFAPNFSTGDINAPLVKKNSYKIRLLIDKASSELFVNNGELVQTNIVFPTEPYNSMKFEAAGSISVEDINVYNLK